MEEVEQRFLDAIRRNPDDDDARMVYADWLEERGERARAAFLRTELELAGMSPDAPRFRGLTAQLRDYVQHIDYAWRTRVARPSVEGCKQFDFACPQRWDAMLATAREDVRHCGSCRRDVYYFPTVDHARSAARMGHCVAIDVTSPRWENDLQEPGLVCRHCAEKVTTSARFCPHCGQRMSPPVPGMYRIDWQS